MLTVGLAHPGLDAQAAILETLRNAIRESQRVNMLYQSFSSPKPNHRKLDPYAIAFHWGWWYVVGYCHTRREVRTFRLDRIQEFSLSAETFKPPEDFDPRAFIEHSFRGQPLVQARLHFTAEAAQIARANRTTWDAFEPQADGSVMVTFSAPDLNWAASSVLAYGPLVEVIGPSELRQTVRDWAQTMVKIYSKEGE
jgi:proteasome accessory factor C